MAQLDVGFTASGNRRRLTASAATKKQAEAKARERPDNLVAMLLDTDVYVRPAGRGIQVISDEGDLTGDDLTEMLSTGYYHLTAEFRRISEP